MATSDARHSSNKGSSRGALIIVGVLALLGLAYALIRVDVLRARIVDVRIELEKVQASNTELQNRLALLGETSHSSSTKLAQLQTELGSVNATVNELRGGAALAQRQSARSEALYLLRLANDQLQLGHDIFSARTSLSAAENVLRLADDPDNVAVHQQVTRALQQLQALPDDAVRIDAQLQRAEQQAANLKLAGILLGNLQSHSEPLPAAGFSRAWALLQQGLSRLIAISSSGANANQSAGALLDADTEQLRRRHLQLLLLNARLARHLHDQPGYAAALQGAHNWLQQYFDGTDAQVSALATQLAQLADLNIAPTVPDLSPSIQALTRQLPSVPTVPPGLPLGVSSP